MSLLLHAQDGYTPLMVHAELGNVVVVTCLIEKKALLDVQDKVCQYIRNRETKTLTLWVGLQLFIA